MSVKGKNANPKKGIDILNEVLVDLDKKEDLKKELDRLNENIYWNTKDLTERIIPWIGANHPDWLEDSLTTVEEALSGDIEYDSISMRICDGYAEIRIEKHDLTCRKTEDGIWTDTYKVQMDDLIEALSGT